MKIAFFSNFLNHHQLSFCLEMCRLTNNNFTFVATDKIPKERLDMGYADMDELYPFVLRVYESEEAKFKAEQIARNWDVVITGSAPERFTKIRIEQNKLTFRYSERVYKRGLWQVFSPKGFKMMHEIHAKYKDAPLYMLCASAYAAMDFAIHGAYINKALKWGYFPEVKQYDIAKLMGRKGLALPSESKRSCASILWAGRLIKWKHPEASVMLAMALKKRGYSFRVSIIGNGEMEIPLRKMIVEKGVSDCVELLGAMPPQKVRNYMEEADIFLFTSDFNEGWGAVLNESMNSGCAVVASHAIGSVPFLVEDGINGMIYRNGDQNDLNNVVMKLLDDKKSCKRIGCEAYRTIKEKWNGEMAAKRFVELCKSLQDGNEVLYKDGPCSKAERIFQWNMYRRCKHTL